MANAALLGTGLIGASIGIGLRSLGWTVTGFDPVQEHVDGAIRVGAIDTAEISSERASHGAQLVILAGPTEATLATLGDLASEALIIDVAGVKASIVRAGAHLPHFVPSHPMAGSETSGPEGASGSLFRGANWVIVTDDAPAEDIGRVTALVESLGAVAVEMTAAEHDLAVALASHVPHLTASAMVTAVADSPAALRLAAGGFRDLTRIAMSKADWWPDVLVENREAVVAGLKRIADELHEIASELDGQDRHVVRRRLEQTAEIRRGLAAPVASVRLVLEDRPGQMALVGAALSASAVDLRDLQLRHATHGGGGVLTLSVNPDESAALANALEMQGFQLVD